MRTADPQATPTWRYFPKEASNLSYGKTAQWLSTLERQAHHEFTLAAGASKHVAMPGGKSGSHRLMAFCHDPILDPFSWPEGQAMPSDRHLVVFGSIDLT